MKKHSALFTFTLVVIVLVLLILLIKDAFSKEISNVVYGSIKYLEPLTITPMGGENIEIKIHLDNETIVFVNEKSGTIYDIKAGQNVSVKYVQFEVEGGVNRVAKEIKLISKVSEIKSLLAAQNDIDYNVKIEASKELNKRGKSAVLQLIEFLEDKNEDKLVRLNAAGALGRIKDIRAIEPLIETLKEDYWLLRNGAGFALVEITGQNFGKDPMNWQNWWRENKAKYFNLIGDCFQQESYSEEEKYSCWLKELIAREEIGQVANPPASLLKCIYKNQIVYYLPSRCCDIPSVLYNRKGEGICAPDGGLTGRGDGRCLDFFNERENCELIWKDSCSYP